MTITQRVWTIIASLWELDLDSWPSFYCIMGNIKGRSRNPNSCTVFRGWKIVELRSSNNLVKNSVTIQLGRAWDPQVMEFSLFLWLHLLVSAHLHEAASILDILLLGRIHAISGPLRCRGLGRGAGCRNKDAKLEFSCLAVASKVKKFPHRQKICEDLLKKGISSNLSDRWIFKVFIFIGGATAQELRARQVLRAEEGRGSRNQYVA